MKRYAFIPADYRMPVVLGWKDDRGFIPDEQCSTRDGLLVRVKTSSDTPTSPPPPQSDDT